MSSWSFCSASNKTNAMGEFCLMLMKWQILDSNLCPPPKKQKWKLTYDHFDQKMTPPDRNQSWLHFKKSSIQIAVTMRATWALLFWLKWPGRLDAARRWKELNMKVDHMITERSSLYVSWTLKNARNMRSVSLAKLLNFKKIFQSLILCTLISLFLFLENIPGLRSY